LPMSRAGEQLSRYEEIYRSFPSPRPTFELAFQYLGKECPDPGAARLVHGDFRLGNLMIDANGLVAALDWELAHIGDAEEDLSWICMPSWRFGGIENPVGGFGQIADLVSGYSAAGGQAINERNLHWWIMFGCLKWGVMCMMMYRAWESGLDRSVERAAIGRRTSETELDLLLLMEGQL
jgi:aminoglycoside phosphotransferase (APT) family kinase protein